MLPGVATHVAGYTAGHRSPVGGVSAQVSQGCPHPHLPTGTLHPNCQDSSGRPRRDIGTILQILNDLLSATRHYQGMPPSLTQLRCHAQCTPDLGPKTTSCEKLAAAAPASLSQARLCKPPGKCPPSTPPQWVSQGPSVCLFQQLSPR